MNKISRRGSLRGWGVDKTESGSYPKRDVAISDVVLSGPLITMVCGGLRFRPPDSICECNYWTRENAFFSRGVFLKLYRKRNLFITIILQGYVTSDHWLILCCRDAIEWSLYALDAYQAREHGGHRLLSYCKAAYNRLANRVEQVRER
jgi:hypothetical protein